MRIIKWSFLCLEMMKKKIGMGMKIFREIESLSSSETLNIVFLLSDLKVKNL
jgi:hypothetical protein